MRKLLIILGLVGLALISYGQNENDTLNLSIVNDSIEYELVVLDPGFTSYLATALPIDFHSNDYYRLWNIRYVAEWNYRCSDPLRYGTLYESFIPYESAVDYGVELNYKLYHYFLYFEQKHQVVLVARGAH